MVKRLLTLGLVAFALSAHAQYQIGNSDFESWGSDANEPGSGWYSFPSAGGSMANSTTIRMSKKNTTKLTGTDARNGGTSVRLQSNYVGIPLLGIGANANGNLTTGKINMGNATPEHEDNYNYSARNTNNCCAFTGHPDAFEYWAKFTRAETGDYNGRCNVIIHGDYDYRDPYETEANMNAYKIATVTVDATPCPTWTKFSGEFSYTNLNYSGKTYVLASFTTNPTPGGSKGDIFDIDDIRFVYYSQLQSLTVNGVSVPGFNKDTYEYTLDEPYTSSTTIVAVDNTKKGVATINVNPDDGYGYNAETAKYSIKVTNEEGTESHIYTIQFQAQSGPEVVDTKTYNEDLYVSLASATLDKQEANVTVQTLDNGNINFVLNNFVLGSGEEAMPIGNISVKNIEVASDNTFTFKGGIELAEGDDERYAGEWWGPDITTDCGGSVPLDLQGKFVGDDHVVVYIFIDTEESLLYSVEVHLGYDAAPMMVNAEAQYGTFCAPFAVEIPSGVQVYTVPSVSSTGELTLSEVTGTIPANTPVVLFAENGYYTGEDDAPLPIYVFGLAESGTPTVGLLTGVYEATSAPVGSYVLQNLDDKVAFYQVSSTDPITVPANRCYLTAPAGSVKALAFPDGTLTSISEIQAADEKAVIYDLSGRRVSKATKGIYIINGKKVIK